MFPRASSPTRACPAWAAMLRPAATLPVTLVMLEAIRDFHAQTGRVVGMKPAGGIRTTKDAIKHLVLINETRPLSATKRWRLVEILEKAK